MSCVFLATALLWSALPASTGGVAFAMPEVLRLNAPANPGPQYPLFADIDGSGRPTLLVGTTGTGGRNGRNGRLLVYPTALRGSGWQFASPRWLDDTTPTGLIEGG